MRGKIWLVLSLATVFLLVLSGNLTRAQTQQQSVPLIVKSSIGFDPYGDLWAWYGPGTELQKLTTWAHNSQPFMSPDGKWVAYTGLSQSTIDGQQTRSDWFPNDMWLLNIATGKADRIGEQLANLTLDQGIYFTADTIRSDPTWSPDGKLLAWDERVDHSLITPAGAYGEADDEHLIVYDVQRKM